MSNRASTADTIVGFNEVLDALNSGIVADTATMTLRDAVSRTLNTGKQSEITITLKIKPVANTADQVSVDSTLKHKMPTMKGSKSEDSTDTTVMYADSKGNLTLFPRKQYSLPGEKVTS